MANFENLVVDAWIGIRADCDISYCINTEEDADFMFSDGQRRFDFAIETEALRKLVEVGGQALAEMDARRSTDDQAAAAAAGPEAAERSA